MKAIVYHEYGSPDVLRCEEVDPPVVSPTDVLIRVRAAAVNPLDWRLMRGVPFLPGPPKPHGARPGRDVAGVVEAVGDQVTRFAPGDEVLGACRGAFAELARAPESALALKPASVTFEQAAAVPIAGLTALQGLRDKGRIRPGQRVLVNGASGGVGTFAVQIAKAHGAEVTGVCSTHNVDLVRSIGADRVVDYTRDNFTQGTERYDLLLDCIGNHPLSACKHVLTRDGRCVIAGGPKDTRAILARTLKAIALQLLGQPFVVYVARGSHEDLATICQLMEAGKVTPVIDRIYPLSAAAEAVRHVETGHARGKVVISLAAASGA